MPGTELIYVVAAGDSFAGPLASNGERDLETTLLRGLSDRLDLFVL